jgi:2'-5' RNA ligase
MPETTRTFVAIAIPKPLALNLARLQRQLAPDISACRWTSGSPFHATLAFLGDVRNCDLDDVVEAVRSEAAKSESFELKLEGMGAFPDARKPRVIWAGLTAGNLEPLLNLREGIVASLAPVIYHAIDERFHPHVTLGRIKTDRQFTVDLRTLVERHRSWSGGAFTVDDVVTFASGLSPGGPSYHALGNATLLAKKTAECA